ncbi:hypothetical protein HaLaN_03752 [Haematococcus lacustris]|uniref:Uncharacterized protein n=1 Tax=Haematococcus lacustris TaxID=44745 RepID=A0A699YHQ2_HAELA|nr:hypothetical protein HaLaN_03752 [Haematococcus lacustris]
MAATKVRFVPSFASVRDIPSILLDSLTHNSSVNGATYDAVVYASSSLGDLARGGALVDIQPYIKNDPKQIIAWSDLPPYESSLASKFGESVSVAVLGMCRRCKREGMISTSFSPAYTYSIIGPVLATASSRNFYSQSSLLTRSNCLLVERQCTHAKQRHSYDANICAFRHAIRDIKWHDACHQATHFIPPAQQNITSPCCLLLTGGGHPFSRVPLDHVRELAPPDISPLQHQPACVMASIMQTNGPTQGWLYDPLTLEPLTNNTAMQQVPAPAVAAILWLPPLPQLLSSSLLSRRCPTSSQASIIKKVESGGGVHGDICP